MLKYFHLLYLLRFIVFIWTFSTGRADTCIPLTEEDFCSGKITIFNRACSFRRHMLNCNWGPIILVKLIPLGIYLEKLLAWERIDFCMIQVAEQGGWSYLSASEVKKILSQAADAGHTDRDFCVCHAEFWGIVFRNVLILPFEIGTFTLCHFIFGNM